MERVSVIIPTYNRAHLLPRAVASVLAALEPGDEVIVVDDGSSDDTRGALAAFDSRVRYLRNEHRGAGAARNIGIDHASHPLIAFLDSDDEWMPDGLTLKRRLMDARPELVFCFSDFALREENGEVTPAYLVNWHHDERSWDDILGQGEMYSSIAPLPAGRADFTVHTGSMYPLLLQQPYVPAWTALVRRELAADELRCAEDLPTLEEVEAFGRIARRGPAAFLNCETAWNHGHSGPRITSDAGMRGYLDASLQLAGRIWGQDAEFMNAHADLYQRTVASLHVRRARWYLSRGMTREAGADIAAAGGAVPRSLRVLGGLPAPVLRFLGNARRRAMDSVSRVR